MLLGQLAVVLDRGGLEARGNLAIHPIGGIETLADGGRLVGGEYFGDLYKHGFLRR